MSRAVPSLSLTLSVAAVTLLAGAGILAAPSVRGCIGDARGIAACVRDKLVRSPILPQQAAAPALVSGNSAPAGWMDAYASELPLREPALASLTASTGELAVGGPELPPRIDLGYAALQPAEGTLSADGRKGDAPPFVARVALADTPVRLASGALAGPATGTSSARLAPPRGTLRAGAGPQATPPPARVTLLDSTGTLLANAELQASIPGATARLLPPAGTLRAGAGSRESVPTATVALVEPLGKLSALGGFSSAAPSASISLAPQLAPPPIATIALIEPVGKLSALGGLSSAVPPATASLIPQPGSISATGGEGVSTRIDASAAPDVTLLPPPPKPIEILTIGTPRTGADAAGSITLQPVIREAALASDAPALPPPAAPPPSRIAFDPAFPNVLVLPPAASGPDSSVVSLTLD